MATHRCTCGHIHAEPKQPAPYGNCGSCGEALPVPTVAAHSCAITPDYARNWVDHSFGYLSETETHVHKTEELEKLFGPDATENTQSTDRN